MKSQKLSPLLGISMLLTFSANAQQSKIEPSPAVIANVEIPNSKPFNFPDIENFDGSYQFIIKENRDFLITTETFALIEKNRSEDLDILFTVNDILDVYIVSKQKLRLKNYVPFKSSYIIK